MPSTPDAVHAFQDARIFHGPGKASNVGGAAVSGLEMSQNSQRLYWHAGDVDEKLHSIVQSIHHHRPPPTARVPGAW